jgi:hypothetical protein
MTNYCYNYIFIICLCGFIYLFILSIFAFSNSEILRIKNKKHKNSGFMLIINSLIYLGLAIFFNYKTKQLNKREGY